MGLRSSDDLFPRFILDELAPGLSGLLIAGILSATMGSLLRLSRLLTLVWAVVMAAGLANRVPAAASPSTGSR